MKLHRKLVDKFRFAFNGLWLSLTKDHSVQIQFVIGLCTVIFFWLLGLSTSDLAIVLLSIGLVLGLEILNSTVEVLADYIQPERDEMIKQIKDMAAGAVMFGAIVAFVIGVMMIVKYGGII